MRGWRRTLLIALAGLLLAGCTGQRVRVDAPALPEPLVVQLPLRVALVVSPAQRAYRFKDEYLAGERLEVGAATAAALARAAHATFASVVEADDVAAVRDVDAVLELVLLHWSISPAPDGYRLRASVVLRLSDPGGEPIGLWGSDAAASSADILAEGGSFWTTLQAGSIWHAPSALVLERLEAALLHSWRDTPPIRAWLESRGQYVAALPAADPAAAASPLPSGVLLVAGRDSEPVRRCLQARLPDLLPATSFVAPRAGRLAIHPWLGDQPPAEESVGRLAALLQVPEARARLAAAGIGRFVVVQGGTQQQWHGGILCGAGYGGGGCLGLSWGDRDTVIVARIVESSGAASAPLSAERHGTAFVPSPGIPLPFIPATQTAACQALARELATALAAPPAR